MECFVGDYRVVRSFARHYETGEVLPQSIWDRLTLSKTLFAGTDLQTQVFYSLLDQTLHGTRAHTPDSMMRVYLDLLAAHTDVPHEPGTFWPLRFSHLYGYGAGYYTYLVCRAFAIRIWKKYFAADPLSREAGERLRALVLSHGGGKHPGHILEEYLQEPLQLERVGDVLIDEAVGDRESRSRNLRTY